MESMEELGTHSVIKQSDLGSSGKFTPSSVFRYIGLTLFGPFLKIGYYFLIAVSMVLTLLDFS